MLTLNAFSVHWLTMCQHNVCSRHKWENPRCVFKKSLKLWRLWERQPMQVCSRDFGKQGVTLQPFLWEYQTKPITKKTNKPVTAFLLSVYVWTLGAPDRTSGVLCLSLRNKTPCKQPVARLMRLCSLTEHTSAAPPRARISCDVTSPESPRACARVLMDADTQTPLRRNS